MEDGEEENFDTEKGWSAISTMTSADPKGSSEDEMVLHNCPKFGKEVRSLLPHYQHAIGCSLSLRRRLEFEAGFCRQGKYLRRAHSIHMWYP